MSPASGRDRGDPRGFDYHHQRSHRGKSRRTPCRSWRTREKPVVKHQAEPHKFLNWVLRPDSGKSVSELVLYKTPNKVAMAQVKKSLAKQYPHLAIPPKVLARFETERDLGKAQPLWSRTVSDIVG